MFEYMRAYAEINLDNIKYNVENIQRRIGRDTKILAIIKADGYGHGSIPIAFISPSRLWNSSEVSFSLRHISSRRNLPCTLIAG